MIIDRQLKILVELCQLKEEYITALKISSKYSVSVRTIQNDLSSIKEFVSKLDFLVFISIPSKGSRIDVLCEERYYQFIDEINQSIRVQFSSSKKERVKKIIAVLFNTKKSISVQHMADRLFVSKSTLLTDLRIAKTVLERYNIKITNRAQNGLSILGDEADIRICIIKENIDILFSYNEFMMIGQFSDHLPKIGDVLVNLLTEHKFRISDIALQNLIVHVDIMVRRIRFGFVLEKINPEWLQQDHANELSIAKKIFRECSELFNISVPDSEVYCLSIYLKGKKDYDENSYITEEVDNFVIENLLRIKDKFGLDFMDNVQLRISLSLHLVPLLMRLKYNMQLKNELLRGVRVSFQLAYDMASSLAYQIKKTYGYQLIEDEVAYFAIYFNSALISYQENKGSNKVLIISELKRSETLLLRERINYWFSSVISELEILDRYQVTDKMIDQYTVVCTTEKNEFYDDGSATLISQFPTEEDYRKIKMAMDGFRNKEDILSLFKKSLVYTGRVSSKEKIIKILCDTIDSHLTNSLLLDEVLLRETMGGTYFGNYVAMPHPMHPVCSQTCIAVGILENDIIWDDEDHRVRIVLLVSMEKDNPKAFQIWSYLSELIHRKEIIDEILSEPSYDKFIQQFSRLLDHMNIKLRNY